MNFMRPNPAQNPVAPATQTPESVPNQISAAKLIGIICITIFSLICMVAWMAFLARMTWSLF